MNKNQKKLKEGNNYRESIKVNTPSNNCSFLRKIAIGNKDVIE